MIFHVLTLFELEGPSQEWVVEVINCIEQAVRSVSCCVGDQDEWIPAD